MTETPVTTIKWKTGYVVARVMHAVGDMTNQYDPYPDLVPATGQIKFTPKTKEAVIPGPPSIRVNTETITAVLDDEGYLSRNGMRGLWLYEGMWHVDPSSVGAKDFDIYVTDKFTEENPLDLWSYLEAEQPENVTVYNLQVPLGGASGQTLIMGADGRLSWGDPVPKSGEGGGATVDLSAYSTTQQIAAVYLKMSDAQSLYATKGEISVLSNKIDNMAVVPTETIVQQVLNRMDNVEVNGA